MNDPDDPDGLFAGDRFTPQTPADSELVDADRLAQLRARIRPTQPLTLRRTRGCASVRSSRSCWTPRPTSSRSRHRELG